MLARCLHAGNAQEWARWKEWAKKSNSEDVKETRGKALTKSVGQWAITGIKYDTDERTAAEHLKSFLENPPKSLTNFIANLASGDSDST